MQLAVSIWPVFRDGDGNDPPSQDPPKGDPPSQDPPKSDPDSKSKTYTQDELNSILAKERRRNEEKTKTTINELEQLRQSKNLTEKEQENLQSRIEELQNTLLTKEELSAKEKEKLKKHHDQQLEQITGERDNWQNRFKEATIVRSITDAASVEDAFDADQIIALLKPNTRLVEDTNDDGESTGTFTPKAKLSVLDSKTGKQVTLDLTIPEAVKHMKDRPEKYGNLFKSTIAGGLGYDEGVGKKGPVDFKNMSVDQYRKSRNKILGRN